MSNNYLPTTYQEFIHLSRYSRWLPEKERRETWDETVARYFDFFTEHLNDLHDYKLTKALREELEEAVLSLKVMPSMRCLMTAGEALKRENIAGFNCSYVAVDRPQAFDEILYVLMNGTGVGFSVERQYISQLPTIADEFHISDTTITVADSKLGWAKALKELVGMLYIGQVPCWDLSKIRPAGAPLKTFGGRASGPEPLEALFNFTVAMFKNANGRKLSSIECHDIVCKIAEVVVVGGVRRSALISLSNLSDDRMRAAKHGQWWTTEPQRSLANNSACYTEKPDIGVFMDEWKALYESKSGERGCSSSN
jgi:ribonucleoside-triphosphate reductase